MNKIKKALQSVRNIKAVIVAAIITGISTLSLAVLTQNSFTLNVEANELKPAVLSTSSPNSETINNLRKELNNSVSLGPPPIFVSKRGRLRAAIVSR